MIIELAKVDGKVKKMKNEADVMKFFSTHGIHIENLKSTKDKKGNLIFSLPHEEDFILQDAEVKASIRTP